MTSRQHSALVLAGVVLAAAGLTALDGHIATTVCPFRRITGIPCPGCGGLRSAHLLLQGDLWGALGLNPLSVLLIVWIVVSVVWLAVDVVRGSDTYINIYHRKWSRGATITAVVILLAQWMWNICRGL